MEWSRCVEQGKEASVAGVRRHWVWRRELISTLKKSGPSRALGRERSEKVGGSDCR